MEVYTRCSWEQGTDHQPLARLALGEPVAARPALGATLGFALPPPPSLLLPRKKVQKPQTPTRGDGGSSSCDTRPAAALLYPAWPCDRLRCTRAGGPGGDVGLAISPERCLSSSHTIPDEPERRNVPLDRCSPAIGLGSLVLSWTRAATEEKLMGYGGAPAVRAKLGVHTYAG